MNRLTIEIEPEQHRQIKTLVPSPEQSRQAGDTTSLLLGSPKNAKRLRGAIASKTPKRLVFETTEDLKRALGI